MPKPCGHTVACIHDKKPEPEYVRINREGAKLNRKRLPADGSDILTGIVTEPEPKSGKPSLLDLA